MGHVEIYRDSRGEWRWRRLADNGNIIADSGEGYVNFQDAHDMASLVNLGVVIEVIDD